MAYKIIPNFFSLKYWDEELSTPIQLHNISYNRCNFHCGFCDYKNRDMSDYKEYSDSGLKKIIKELLPLSKYFKFTGGEPTLNPKLINDLRIVNLLGGHVFLDSNGSNYKVIEQALQENLIEVLGISLKGVTKETAQEITNVRDPKLCWENTFKTLEIAEKYNVKVIVTMVFFEGVPIENIILFANILSNYKKTRMKINNLITCKYQGDEVYEAYSPEKLESAIKEFLLANPEWTNRITLVNSNSAMRRYADVIFL